MRLQYISFILIQDSVQIGNAIQLSQSTVQLNWLILPTPTSNYYLIIFIYYSNNNWTTSIQIPSEFILSNSFTISSLFLQILDYSEHKHGLNQKYSIWPNKLL